MTREDIIRMAQEAGLWEIRHSVEMAIGGVGELERFAALVASAEREACAKIGDDHPSWSSRMYSATIRARGQE
jgi:hypothetical protein